MSLVRRVRLLLVPLVAVFAVAGVSAAAAAPPTSGSGTFTTTTSQFVNVTSAGGNTIVNPVLANATLTGTFTGTIASQGMLVFHADGSANVHDTGDTFTGTVNGTAGTVTFQAEGGASPDGSFEITYVIVSGTGGLANLHGKLIATGTLGANGPVGTYTDELQSGQP